MRSAEDMMRRIRTFVDSDKRIRLALLNGSRADKQRRTDAFSDFDLACFVDDFSSFLHDLPDMGIFGETLIVHTSNDMLYLPDDSSDVFMVQSLYQDGHRIDFAFRPLAVLEKHLEGEPKSLVVTDKDNRLSRASYSGTTDFRMTIPSEKMFQSALNTFWWLVPYVVKGLIRREWFYAERHLRLLRDIALDLLCWEVTLKKPSFNPGSAMRHASGALNDDDLQTMLKAQKNHSENAMWQSLHELCVMVLKRSETLAESLGYAMETTTYRDVHRYALKMRRKHSEKTL